MRRDAQVRVRRDPAVLGRADDDLQGLLARRRQDGRAQQRQARRRVRAEAKVAYLLPLVLGVQVAGARVVSIQARWALAALTGRSTWPRTLRIPTALRRQACADLGWPCLWAVTKVAAHMAS